MAAAAIAAGPSTDGVSPRKRFDRRLAGLERYQTDYLQLWRELAEFNKPESGQFLDENDRQRRARNRNERVINSTGRMALRTLAAGLMSGLTSPARPWFRLATPDPDMMEVQSVKDWLFIVETRMRTVFARSNLYNVLPSAYADLGNFGTTAILCLEDPRTVVRFYPQTIGSYYLGLDERNDVDTLYRKLRLTVWQIARQFGITNASSRVQEAYKRGSLDDYIDVVHVIEPNQDRAVGMADSRNMRWHSCWYEKACEDERTFLKVSGFNENPILAPRWETIGEDVYGTSCPGMVALGDIKALQYLELQKATAVDKLVNPPMAADPSLKNMPSSLLPGGVTYVAMTNGSPGFAPAYTIRPELQPLLLNIQAHEERVRSAFFADLFLMMAMDDRSGVTAREVAERHEEKLLMLGPVLERLNSELLNRLIDRGFAAMLRAGWIPPPPPELENVELKVEYISVLAQAQHLVAMSSIDRLWATAGQIAQVKPDVLDKLDADETIDTLAEMLGTPPGIVLSDDKVAETRAERAQQQAAATAMAAAKPAVDVVKGLSQVDLSKPNVISRAAGTA